MMSLRMKVIGGYTKTNLPCGWLLTTTLNKLTHYVLLIGGFQGRMQDFKLEAHLKESRRAERGAKMFGVFRVKNHDFTQKKNHLFFPF